jgi:DNA polymerase-3 subunit alpha
VTELSEQLDKAQARIAGSISAIERKYTRKEAKPFAVMTVEDFTGSVEVMVWADVFARAVKELELGKIVAITAKIDRRDDSVRLIATEVEPITRGKRTPVLTIDLPLEKTDEGRLLALRDLILQFPGPQPLYLRFRTNDGRELKLKAHSGYCVRDEEEFRTKLAELLA